MTKLIKSLLAAGALLSAASSANAVVVVDYNSAGYVTTGTTFNGWTSSGRSFDDSSSTTSPTSGYSGPIFYGGGTVSASSGSGSFSSYLVANNQSGAGGDDPIRLATTWSGTSVANEVKFYGVFVFNQSNWLSLNSGEASLAAANAFTVSGFRASNHSSGESGVRFLIEKAGSYYVTALNTVGTSYGAVTLSNPSSANWFSYDPATNLSTIGSAAMLADFSGITAVGFMVELGSTGASATGANTLWSDFQVTAVPEPSTIALLLGFVSLGLALHRRRRAA